MDAGIASLITRDTKVAKQEKRRQQIGCRYSGRLPRDYAALAAAGFRNVP